MKCQAHKTRLAVGSTILCGTLCYVLLTNSFEGKGFVNPLPSPTRALKSVDNKLRANQTSSKHVAKSVLQPNKEFVVPRLVHYVWFGESSPLKFHHMLSMLSAHKFLNPDHIWLHCDYEPVGEWWKYLTRIRRVPMKIMKRRPPKRIYNNLIYRPEHQADVARIDILIDHGGIYLDTDVIVLKSFDPLRKYNMTMGIEYHGKPGRLNSGVLVAQKNTSFLHIWRETFKNFSGREWDEHSCIIPYNLRYVYPHLIHVEERTLNYPSGLEKHLIYDSVYDWSHNYAIHLWHRLYEREHSPETIKDMNTTFGQIARYVFYGSQDMM